MEAAALIRTLGLFLPASGALLLWAWRRPGRSLAAGVLLACAWNIPSLLGLHVLASAFDWWSFEAQGGLLLGLPVDLYLGWALLWGALPALAAPRLNLGLLLALMLAFDLVWMPLAEPVVQLGDRWLVGEILGLLVCLLPAQLLARWTRAGRHLAARATLQATAFSGLMLGVIPAVILQLTGDSWGTIASRPTWATGLALQLIALPAVVGLSAVQEFASRGGGTPVPYDPPRRLVTSGVYAYLANPMQASMSLMFLGWGFLLGSAWVAAAGVIGAVYSAGLAAWSERDDMAGRFGEDWRRYRLAVRPWIPRWRPWIPDGRHAKLFLAEFCVPCSQLAAWFGARNPAGLRLLAAEDYPGPELRRLTYLPADGAPAEQGMAALARGLEHLHLGWAFVGWTIRLPFTLPFLQLLVDAVGEDARPAHAPPSDGGQDTGSSRSRPV